MSEAHVAKFAEIVASDPALVARLGMEQVSDEASAHSFVTKAVKEAKAVGLEFTEEEGYEWMKREAASESQGELSDTQLEQVAGGQAKQRFTTRGLGIGVTKGKQKFEKDGSTRGRFGSNYSKW